MIQSGPRTCLNCLKKVIKLSFLDQSPISSHCLAFDVEHIEETKSQYFHYAMQYFNQNQDFWNNKFLEDLKWRKKFGLNVVLSIHGDQGTGKSSILIALYKMISQEFGTKFNLTRDLFYDVSSLNKSLSTAKMWETRLLDEQKVKTTGIMSSMQMGDLADYENQLRRNRNNLLYASPEERHHSHFFVFKTYPYIKRNESGYPEFFSAVLFTKRYFDDIEMPRGLLTFPMMSEKEFKEYDKFHVEHIKKLQDKSYSTLVGLEDDAKKVISEKKKYLIEFGKDSFPKIVNKSALDLKIYETLGTEKYTRDGYELLREKVRELLREGFK